MPKVRSRHKRQTGVSVIRLANGRPRSPNSRDQSGNGTSGCVASLGCERPPIEDSPVRLCGHHLREVYEFAQDLVTQRWDGAVRDYEQGWHRLLADFRTVGEWFRADDEVLAAIGRVVASAS